MGEGESMKKQALVYLLFFFPFFAVANESVGPIVVADFAADKDSEEYAEMVSELVLSEIGKVSYFAVVEREQLEKLLEEQKLQLSGITSQSDAVTIGEIANAQYIIIGKVNKTGMSFTISARVVSVESGEIFTSENVLVANEADFRDGCAELAKRLTNRIELAGTRKREEIEESNYIADMQSMLADRYWNRGEYAKVKDIAYGLPLSQRLSLADSYRKKNASGVMLINIIPLGLGSAFIDKDWLPFTFQALGGAVAVLGFMFGDISYGIAGAIVAVGGYIYGYAAPFVDQKKYNKLLLDAMNLDDFGMGRNFLRDPAAPTIRMTLHF